MTKWQDLKPIRKASFLIHKHRIYFPQSTLIFVITESIFRIGLLKTSKSMFFSSKRFLYLAFYLCFIALLSACNSKTQTEKKIKKDTASTAIEGSLVFNNVTLEQADEKGRPLWKVKAKQAIYTKDKKLGRINNPTGDLYQDGQIVLKASADSGEILENGQIVFLKGKITATDTRNGAVFNGDQLEWRPKEDLLVVRNNLKGSHPQLQATGKEGRYFSRKQQLELIGQVSAISKDPDFQMKTEHLFWKIKEKQVTGDKRIQIERYKDKAVTDRVEADKSEINLQTKIAILKQNVQLTSVEPPVLMSTNAATWNINARTVVSDQPVKIVHQKEEVIITANQGQIDLEKKVANLTGGVQGVGSRNQAKLYSNQLTWDIPTQNVQASGNVVYQQINPPFNLKGATAVGKIQDQSIVVKGGDSGNRVVTEIIP
jgi:LPS export ABC transporter protein LptC